MSLIVAKSLAQLTPKVNSIVDCLNAITQK